MVVKEVLETQGYSIGERTVFEALGGRVSLRLIRPALKVLKASRARERRERIEANRLSIVVDLKDVVWCLDGMHLGRDEDGHENTGQVLRDVATLRDLAVTVGPPVTGEDVIALLDRVKAERGTLPLVLMTDNGSAYKDRRLRKYLWRRKVVHLRSVPRTPQHNPWAEQAVRELKEDSGLGKGVVTSHEVATVILAASRYRVDECRLRPSLGYRTARVCDEATPSWYDRMRREEVYRAVRRALAAVRLTKVKGRARRRQERMVTLVTLGRFELLGLTRGGEPLPAEKPDTIT